MKAIKNSVLLFAVLTLLTGVVYPAAVTVLAQYLFPREANGSIIYGRDGTPVGSALIGQPFSGPKYFWSRPSATSDFPDNPMASGGSNLGPTSRDLITQVSTRVGVLRRAGVTGPIPPDMVTASASGLDPHISFEAALVQVPRVAKARAMREEELQTLVEAHLEDRQIGFLGAPRVNVLKLNLDLDAR